MTIVEKLEEIHSHFAKHHIKLKKDWLREVLNYLLNMRVQQSRIIDLVYHQWLYTNIEQSTEPGPSFQPNCKGLEVPFLFQIQSLSDIGTPQLKQFKRITEPDYNESTAELGSPADFDNPTNNNKGCKCFRIDIIDARRTSLKAFEMRRIPQLTLSTCPGSKILIFGGTKLEQGFLSLTPNNCQILGGAVHQLLQDNHILMKLSQQLNRPIPVRGARPPPPPIPQQNDDKIGSSSSKPPPPIPQQNDDKIGSSSSKSWIKLNVGGKLFMTTRQTLCRECGSFLARLSQEDHSLPSEKDESGSYLIDRDSDYFSSVLNYLRHGKFVLDHGLSEEGLREEAEFYNLPELIALCNERIAEREKLKRRP